MYGAEQNMTQMRGRKYLLQKLDSTVHQNYEIYKQVEHVLDIE